MVDRRVIGVEELESDVSFLKFFRIDFFHKGPFFYEKKFFLLSLIKGNQDRGTRI
jgi:hypothetical protein